MEETYLYDQIAESIRQEIIKGTYIPGDKLPSVRELSRQWGCTQGTVQRAYNQLAQIGLVESRAGKGTRVKGKLTPEEQKSDKVLRWANLVNKSEEFLLEALTKGYSLEEVQTSIDMAMDRWKSFSIAAPPSINKTIQFIGSHDPMINSLSKRFSEFFPGFGLKMSFTGSMGGLIAMKERRSDLAGSHLWDFQSDSYNLVQVQEIFKEEKMVLLTIAHRRLGFILPPGNPQKITSFFDIVSKRIRFANRQAGSGTRVWFDTMLSQNGIAPDQIVGYEHELNTHSEIGRVIAEGSAGVGIGLESVAIAYGLDFKFLTLEQYDLVFSYDNINKSPYKEFIEWVNSPIGKDFINQFPGYDTRASGQIRFSI